MFDQSSAEYRNDAFISYSRRDRSFAVLLEKALEAYSPPRGLALPSRALQVFRDESDFTGVEYHESVSKHLSNSAKLIVLCSPHARASEYVNDEIRRFVQSRGAGNVVPVLVSGKANNEAGPEQEGEMAFPQALVEAMKMPLAVSYLDFDPARNSVSKGVFYGPWCTLLANLYGVSRSEIEQRETRRRARRLRTIVSVVGIIIVALSAALVVTVLSRNEATRQRDQALISGSRALAGLSAEKTRSGDATTGMLLAMEALPDPAVGRVRPYVLEAEAQLFQARQAVRELAVLAGHVGEVSNGVFSLDELKIVTASADGTALVWDARTGTQLAALRGHSKEIWAASISADGSRVLTTSWDNTARLWDSEGGQELRVLEGRGKGPPTARFSPDGTHLVTISEQHATAFLCDARTGLQCREPA
jgi:TIR domain/WD domain, G-beta repeat